MAEVRAKLAPGTPIEVWFQDEMRVGQKNKLIAGPGRARDPEPRMISAPSRPICSARSAPNMEPALPSFCPSATPKPCSFISIDEIGARVTAGAHAIIILDQAGWHGAKDLKIPRNLSLLPLPPRAPELNPQENIWQFMRQNWLSNQIFKSFDDIVDHCCYAWNTLIDQPWKIMSIARRDWAVVGQSI